MRSKLAFVVALAFAGPGFVVAAGAGAEAGRHAAHLPPRQPAQRARSTRRPPSRRCSRSWRIFNNLVVYDQQKQLNTPETIVPDLAESWAWDATKTKLTFKLRQGVKWHDGKPFTAKDVQCTWNKLTGKDADDFRKNPRAIW